jgi:hypothetical protein
VANKKKSLAGSYQPSKIILSLLIYYTNSGGYIPMQAILNLKPQCHQIWA